MGIFARIKGVLQPGERRTFVYQIDSRDRLVSVDQEWLSFAEENNTPGLSEQTVIGTPIWRWIQGDAVRDLYNAVYTDVRRRSRGIEFPYRCDAPGTRRYMKMAIEPTELGGIIHRSTIVRSEPVTAHERAEQHTSDVECCAICRRLKAGKGTWLELEPAIREYDLMGQPPDELVRHVVCSHCRESVMGE